MDPKYLRDPSQSDVARLDPMTDWLPSGLVLLSTQSMSASGIGEYNFELIWPPSFARDMKSTACWACHALFMRRAAAQFGKSCRSIVCVDLEKVY